MLQVVPMPSMREENVEVTSSIRKSISFEHLIAQIVDFPLSQRVRNSAVERNGGGSVSQFQGTIVEVIQILQIIDLSVQLLE